LFSDNTPVAVFGFPDRTCEPRLQTLYHDNTPHYSFRICKPNFWPRPWQYAALQFSDLQIEFLDWGQTLYHDNTPHYSFRICKPNFWTVPSVYHPLATILSVQAGSECRIRPGRDRWQRNATLLDSKSTIGHTVRYFLPWVKCDLEDFWNKSDTVESIPLYGWSVSIGFYREN